MNSSSIEYHTRDFTKNFIYSDWKLFGIKARYIKVIIIALSFLIILALQVSIVHLTDITPFLLFFIAIIIGSLLSGFQAGTLITVLSVIAIRFWFLPSMDQYYDDLLLLIFFCEGIFFSSICEVFLRLLRRLRRQADLLALSSEAIIVRDIDTNEILFWSKGAEKTYGFAKQEVIGKNVDELLQTTAPIPFDEIKKIILTKGTWEGEIIHCKRNSKKLVILSRLYLKENDQDRPSVIVETNTDITKQKALERRKDEFLSIASHELKTPVTSIKAFTQILEARFKKIGDQTSQLYLFKMNTQLDRLTNLVNDLLDSTRIEAGKLELNIEPFKISNLVDEVIENMQLTSPKHSIIRKGNSLEMVWADRDRTEQVLINLINNAIKYSPLSDKVEVYVVEEVGFVKIGVEDRGIGIPKNKIHKIFDRFYRVDAKEGEFTGLGLGLYISAEIVKRQSGQMWVESEEKMGSVFYFTLPTKRMKEE